MEQPDLLIGGAGPVGCVIAERANKLFGWRCLIVEKRDHIGGNCYDRWNDDGILVHQYGPHYFRTNSEPLRDYLSSFTEWIPGNYVVKSFTRGELFPFPINLQTLGQFFGRDFSADEARKFLDDVREPIKQPSNSEEFVLSRVGRELYEAFYLGYTLKQWGLHPRELAPSVCGRIPVRFNEDCRYVDHGMQITPAEGFTRMFERMIDRPGIDVLLNTDFREAAHQFEPSRASVYCGPVDEYFEHKLGHLPWRSLEFEFRTYEEEYRQPCVQINYPNDFDYTRSVEIKHVTRQKHPLTSISYEYPRAMGDPYYPIPAIENQALYLKYEKLAERETQTRNVFFCGRLAKYRYINTDEAIEMALETVEELRALAGR